MAARGSEMNATDETNDNFKYIFKYFKKKLPPPNYSDVVGFDDKGFKAVSQLKLYKNFI